MIEKNTIIQGDCLEEMHDIPDGSVDLIVTDPPYLVQYKTGYRQDKQHEFCTTIAGDDDDELITEYIKECYRVLKNDSALYMFCSCNKVAFFKQKIEELFTMKNMIVWVKNNWTAGDLQAQYGKQYELIFLANKGRALINGKRLSDVWSFKRVAGNTQQHQNQKPLALIMQCIEKHSKPGDTVFDGFAGSFTTAVACYNLKRNWICIEKEEKYCEIGQKRLDEVTRQASMF